MAVRGFQLPPSRVCVSSKPFDHRASQASWDISLLIHYVTIRQLQSSCLNTSSIQRMRFQSAARWPCPPHPGDGFQSKASEIAHPQFIAQAGVCELCRARSLLSTMGSTALDSQRWRSIWQPFQHLQSIIIPQTTLNCWSKSYLDPSFGINQSHAGNFSSRVHIKGRVQKGLLKAGVSLLPLHSHFPSHNEEFLKNRYRFWWQMILPHIY